MISRLLLLLPLVVLLAVTFAAAADVTKAITVPFIEGDWWQVAGEPDLGKFTDPDQQPVDFSVWQAGDGNWQLWSCIRHTKCGGNTRLFYGWESAAIARPNWKPMGIKMQADTSIGE